MIKKPKPKYRQGVLTQLSAGRGDFAAVEKKGCREALHALNTFMARRKEV